MPEQKLQQDQQSPYSPAGAQEPYVFEGFEGMNTATLRPGVEDNECAWLDGFMPLGPKRNLRTMPDHADPILLDRGLPIDLPVVIFFFNIGSTPYLLVVKASGEINAYNTVTGGLPTIVAFAGTIINPSQSSVGITSYGNQYVLIVSKQTDGYFIFDGTTTYYPGGPAPGGGTMPLGIGGTAAEVYAGRIWIANGPTIYFSSPGSLILFGSSGGGNFSSSDSFLRVNFTGLKQTNGFLYLIADSSINYISGVQTSGSPATTTFTNQNLDPETGTPWPSTIDVFNRNIIFANPFGAHIGYGGAVSKVSEKLDGVYNTVPNFASFFPSSAKAIVYGKKIWMLLLPIIDPITGQQVNKLLCWNGKIWWATSQSIDLQYIATQEINSVLTAWGVSGLSAYKLFQTPSSDFVKIAQSKLWDKPGIEFTKFAARFWGIFKYYSNSSPALTVSIDNERDSASSVRTFDPLTLLWVNDVDDPIVWTNNLSQTIAWIPSSGFTVAPPDAVGQNGVLIGMTISTRSADMAIVTAKLAPLQLGYRG